MKPARFESASCRSCDAMRLRPVLDMGMMPQSDGFLTEDQLDRPESRRPLEVGYCEACGLVQILETVRPEELFGEDYVYFSSYSDELLAHSRRNVAELAESLQLGSESLIVELASNDGYLLKEFIARGIPVLGIDPAPQQAVAANLAGVPTRCEFFTRALADQLVAEGLRADVVIANNVLAHVADTNGFVDGIARLLKPGGTAVLEVPYVRDLVDHCEFDTIYHEHLCYFSVGSLVPLFGRHGLTLTDVRRIPIHGGSLRLFVRRGSAPGPAAAAILDEEARDGVNLYGYYEAFAQRVATIRERLSALVGRLLAEGRRIAAYGAAAKGTILLNYVGLDRNCIPYVVDRNVHKHGRYVPGVRIPIAPVSRLIEDRPDYVLLLPWNFRDEILAQQARYRALGGRFIIPIPEPRVV